MEELTPYRGGSVRGKLKSSQAGTVRSLDLKNAIGLRMSWKNPMLSFPQVVGGNPSEKGQDGFLMTNVGNDGIDEWPGFHSQKMATTYSFDF
jgi:hypothetical protein